MQMCCGQMLANADDGFITYKMRCLFKRFSQLLLTHPFYRKYRQVKEKIAKTFPLIFNFV